MPPELFNYQKPHVDQLELALNKYRAALDASDLGTGKTICACEIARRGYEQMIVVAKKVMLPTWRYWMEMFGVSGVVGNWELARRRGLPERPRALYVFDEAHEGAGYNTLNARLVINTFNAKHPVLLLSATAIESPLKMWALGYVLGLHNLNDFYPWMFRNGVVRNFGFPGYHFNGSRGALQNINRWIFPARGSRMRKIDIPDFPECQFIVELVEPEKTKLLDKWFKQIDIREAEHELKMEEANEEKPWSNAQSILPEILFARMRAEISKVPALLEFVKEGGENGYSVVVFVNFLTTLAALEELLCLSGDQLIHGEQKQAARLGAIESFQAGRTKLLCATIDSGGASIDLHDLKGDSPRMSLVCPTWRAVTFRQALGRVHRAGALSKSIQKLVFLSSGIEQRVAARVREKLSAIDTVNDSDLNPEPEFAESLK